MAAFLVVFAFAPSAALGKRILVYTGGGAVIDTYSKFEASAGRALDYATETLPLDLSDNYCVLLPANTQAFTTLEQARLKTFALNGGTIVAMAENVDYPGGTAATAVMNSLAAYVGVAMSGGVSALDSSYHSTSAIFSSPYTAGVATIGYAYTNRVSVGAPASPLVATQSGQVFIGVQQVGAGKFVYSGDTNVFSDAVNTPYVVDSNARFVKNLCGDVVPPEITIVTPPNGTRYKKGAAVNANWSCTDFDGDVDTRSFTNEALSGTISGAPIDTTAPPGASVTKSYSVDCKDKAGNVAPTKTHQYVVDDRPPAITINVPTAGPYALGSSVAASWSCTDPDDDIATKGYTNGPLSGSQSGEAIDTSTKGVKSFTVNCTDLVGNSAPPKTVQYTVSNSPPVATITAPVSGARFKPGQAANANWGCSDPDGPGDIATKGFTNGAGSGTQSGLPIDTSIAGGSTVAKTFAVTCTDSEGATSAPKLVTYFVDPSLPVATIAVPLDGGVYERGAVVPASWGCSDDDGPGDIDPNPLKTFGTKPVGEPIDTAGVGTKSFSVTCTDLVGNVSLPKTVHYTVIDASPPVVTITVPKDGATYVQGQVVPPSYACTDPDGITDIRSCVREGGATGPVDTSKAGTFNFTVNGEDLAGNKGTATVRYTVTAKATTPGGSQVSGSGKPSAPAKACKSRRQFRIRVKKLSGGVRAVSATVFVNGKRTLTRKGKRVTATVTLKGLKKGTYKVKINVKYSNGRTLSYTRRFKTCTPKGG